MKSSESKLSLRCSIAWLAVDVSVFRSSVRLPSLCCCHIEDERDVVAWKWTSVVVTAAEVFCSSFNLGINILPAAKHCWKSKSYQEGWHRVTPEGKNKSDLSQVYTRNCIYSIKQIKHKWRAAMLVQKILIYQKSRNTNRESAQQYSINIIQYKQI